MQFTKKDYQFTVNLYIVYIVKTKCIALRLKPKKQCIP